MMIYRLPIDIKSLYLNMTNDNESGHTATVATPLKQGNSYRSNLGSIMDIPECINSGDREAVVSAILGKSKTMAQIVKICLFDKITVNGYPVETDESFCIYVREETSKENVHFGRQKIHYPMSLKFDTETQSVNNKRILKAISEKLKNYAFIVVAFEYNTESKILNFDALIVGTEGIPYSKVFVNHRGVGQKYVSSTFFDGFSYDTEILALREKLGYDRVDLDNFDTIMKEYKKMAIENIRTKLAEQDLEITKVLSEQYPNALYDIEYKEGNVKKYAIIKNTATKLKKFVLPADTIRFINDFSSQVTLFLVAGILDEARIFAYSAEDLTNARKQIQSIAYDASEI